MSPNLILLSIIEGSPTFHLVPEANPFHRKFLVGRVGALLTVCSSSAPLLCDAYFACTYPGVLPPVRHRLHRLAMQRIPLQFPHDRPVSGLHPSSHLLPHTFLAHSAPHMPPIGCGTASAIRVSGPIPRHVAGRRPLPVPPSAVLSAAHSTPPRPSPCLPELPHTSCAHSAPHTPSIGRGAIPPSRASGPITLHLRHRPPPSPCTLHQPRHRSCTPRLPARPLSCQSDHLLTTAPPIHTGLHPMPRPLACALPRGHACPPVGSPCQRSPPSRWEDHQLACPR